MNVLIINNDSKHLAHLQELFTNSHHTIEWLQINQVDLSTFDLIILSGSSSLSVLKDFDRLYGSEVQLILKADKPIVGICFGCELIAYTFGAKLKRLHNKQKGITSITPQEQVDIFKDLGDLKDYEAHRWAIVSLPNELEGLASSSTGMEIIRHRSKPIYGLQFHPEEFCDKSSGDEILGNIINQLS